jgi:SAM-dependent methyltransferase
MPLSFIHKVYRRLPKPPSTNYATGQYDKGLYKLLGDRARVLDLGAKDARGKNWPGLGELASCFTTDISFAPGVDFLADAHSIPFERDTLDAVRCIDVLQYCHRPSCVMAEIWRVLKPGGVVYISMPFVFRSAPDPVDYWRLSCAGLRLLCADFEPISSGFNRGPASTMADMLTHFFAIIFSFNNKALHDIGLDVFQWCFFWMKYLDRFVARYETANIIHNGSFFLGRKPTKWGG